MRKYIIVLFLALASFCAHAEVNLGAFEQLNTKIQCIISLEGGFKSPLVKELCIDKKDATKKAIAQKKDNDKVWHYRHVGGNKFKTALLKAVRNEKTKQDKEKAVEKMTQKALDALSHLSDKEKAEALPLLSDHYRFLVGLSSEDKKWIEWRDKNKRIEFVVYEKGQKFHDVVFGNAQSKHNVVGDWLPYKSHFTGNRVTTVPGDEVTLSTGTKISFLFECWNLAAPVVVAPPPTPVITGSPPSSPPPFKITLKKDKMEREALVEVNAGVWAGKYFGNVYGGGWAGGQIWGYVPIEKFLGTEEQISAGIGVYSSADWGNSHVSAYGHQSHRVLGLAGIKGNGFNEDFVPHWWSANLGYGPDWLRGGNPETGYWMKQRTWLGRVYAEYMEQHGQMLYGGFAEGFLDMGGGGDYHSSWNGFPGEGRSSSRIGGFAEYRFHPHFSVKAVAEATFWQTEGVTSRFGGDVGLYGCYRNGWDEGYGFAIACAGGGLGFGQGVVPFVGANVFVGQVFTHYIDHKRAEGVTYEPAEYEYAKPEVSRIPGSTYVPSPIQPNTGDGSKDGPQQKH